MEKRPHPAKYSKELLPILAKYAYGNVLDIMGGTGKAGLLKALNPNITRVTINELEPEWAEQAFENNVDEVIIGDAKNLRLTVDCIVTSPPYGNRMADNFHVGANGGKSTPSIRKMYASDLGRTPSEGSTCCLHFGRGYEEKITDIYESVFNNCKFNRFVLNVSNFIRNYQEVEVCDFYEKLFYLNGFVLVAKELVKTRRQKGIRANAKLRVPYETVMVFEVGKRINENL